MQDILKSDITLCLYLALDYWKFCLKELEFPQEFHAGEKLSTGKSYGRNYFAEIECT